MKRLTESKGFEHTDYKSINVVAVRHNLQHFIIYEPEKDPFKPRRSLPYKYIAGSIVDKLAAYEELGYEPEELEKMLAELGGKA